ncbi:MAG: outer membrane protein assembly factor BamE, partial [bacterium]|nr:outer membrane protein assembly factor BamE [bacterium]
MSLVYSGIETGIGALESAAVTKTKKIGEDQLAQLKPGMTREEVRELLQKPPMMITTKEDGGSTATYIYNTDSQNRDRSMMGIIG